MDVAKYANTNNMENNKLMEFQRPQDKEIRKMFTYIQKDMNEDERMWLKIVPHKGSCVKSMMANIKKRPELNIVKKVHLFTHGNRDELSQLFTEAGMMTPKIDKAIRKVTLSCNPCATSGRPANTRKISLGHVNQKFNIEIQTDLLTIKTDNRKYELINILDLGTG